MLQRLSCGILLLAVVQAPGCGQRPWEHPGTEAGEEIIGPDGEPMVWVPPGAFTMGSTDEDVASVVARFRAKPEWCDDEQPAHQVRFTRGFWLGKHEVTNAAYRAFCQAAGRRFPSKSGNGPEHPVVWVGWDDAHAYCHHYGLRLPTEAEWEYAARGPQGLRYPWGNLWEAENCSNREAKDCYNAHNEGPTNAYPPTIEAGSLPSDASWCGALDLAGNVEEWCMDWYDHAYYSTAPAEDPTGPAGGQERVVRGGRWSLGAFYCRSASRGCEFPVLTLASRGFRCAFSPT